MTFKLPCLAYEIDVTRNMGRRTGFYTRARRTDWSWRGGREWRKTPKVWTATPSTDSGAVPARMLELYSKHNEVWVYLDKSPWVPDHMIERFRVLTQRTTVLFSAYATEDLVRTELHDLHYRSACEAYNVIRDLEALLRQLMSEAVREEANDQYAVMQKRFAALQASKQEEDEAYAALDSSYQRHMSASRVPELS